MPRPAKGPRLYLLSGRADAVTGQRLPDVYVIRDRQTQIGTGCGPGDLAQAEACLSLYLARKLSGAPLATIASALAPTPFADPAPAPRADGPLSPPQPVAVRQADPRGDPRQVLVAEVLALYSTERAAGSGLDPSTFDGFITNLLDWWQARTLDQVRRSTCQAYAAHRQSQPQRRYKNSATAPRVSSQTARRELEELNAAIAHWDGEHKLVHRPKVWLPDKKQSPRDALTRDQAARLLKAALGWRRKPCGRWERLGPSARANRAHLRRFILIGLYTGTRHKVMRVLLWDEAMDRAWVDLDGGMIYRRGRGERETNKRRPVVRLPRRLLAHLRRWRALDHAQEALTRRSDEAFRLNSVLHHGGRPLAGKIRTGFQGCVRDAGLDWEITPHWMRHTAATWLMEGGADMWMAAGYLGMSVTTLEKHYGHHRPTYQAQAARAIAGRRG
jgi:integrase